MAGKPTTTMAMPRSNSSREVEEILPGLKSMTGCMNTEQLSHALSCLQHMRKQTAVTCIVWSATHEKCTKLRNLSKELPCGAQVPQSIHKWERRLWQQAMQRTQELCCCSHVRLPCILSNDSPSECRNAAASREMPVNYCEPSMPGTSTRHFYVVRTS